MIKNTVLTIVFLLAAAFAQAEEKRFDVPVGDSPVLGPPDAPVTVIEFIDFQ